MDALPSNKRLVLVAILLLCFLSIPVTEQIRVITNAARSLCREISKGTEKGKHDNPKPKEKREINGQDLIKLFHGDVSNQKKLRKMDALPSNKRLVLVAILLLCFLSIPATEQIRVITNAARSLCREISKGAEKGKHDNPKPKEKRETNGQDLITMDYTPARKKTPVHN